jgi:hypothetical protein
MTADHVHNTLLGDKQRKCSYNCNQIFFFMYLTESYNAGHGNIVDILHSI